MNDNNENKNSLASGRKSDFLNKYLKVAFLLMAAIILMILFGCKVLFAVC
jgi:hypothetical protein